MEIHLTDPKAVFPDSNLRPLVWAYDKPTGVVYLQRDVDALSAYIREHDPDLTHSTRIQKQKDKVVTLTTLTGETVSLDMAGLVGTTKRRAGVRPTGPGSNPCDSVIKMDQGM
jgi:hypothetical protein